MSTSTLKIGSVLKSGKFTYEIEDVLGQGSFGITYRAKVLMEMKGQFGEEIVEMAEPMAIKEFFMREINARDDSGSVTSITEGSLSHNYAMKFVKEAKCLAEINHPNIVNVNDFMEANNTYYYVMEYVEGQNLNDYIKTHHMEEREVESTIRQVAEALMYMHEQKQMLHLDLKPGNIMRRASDGHIFLIDFGLSKHFSQTGEPESSTSVGLGTPGYAPIEQANQKTAQNFRPTLDVYALGATMYKLLTHQTPPTADELISTPYFLETEMQKRGISQHLGRVVLHAMTLNVNQRTPNIRQFINELDVLPPPPPQFQLCVLSVEGDGDALLIPRIRIWVGRQMINVGPDGRFFLTIQDFARPQIVRPEYLGTDLLMEKYFLDNKGTLHVVLKKIVIERNGNNRNEDLPEIPLIEEIPETGKNDRIVAFSQGVNSTNNFKNVLLKFVTFLNSLLEKLIQNIKNSNK